LFFNKLKTMKTIFTRLLLIGAFLILTNSLFSQIVITPTIAHCLCYGDNNGGIYISVSGGTPPYTYLWSTNSIDTIITGLSPGDYSVTVTDDVGSTQQSGIITVTGPTQYLSLTLTTINASCNGLSDGEIHLYPTGGTPPYTYTWAPTGFTINNNIYSGLPTGCYAVTITDVNGCAVMIPKIDIMEIMISVDSIGNATNGVCNGYIDVDVEGGISPYVYSWNTGDNTEMIDNLCDGSYQLSVTDSTGCQIDTSLIIENTYVSPYTFVDTLLITIDTCIFNVLLPVDSAYIYDFNLIGQDSVMLNWVFWQAGDSITLNVSLSLATLGSNLVYLEIVCNSKSNRAVTIYRFYGVFNTDELSIQKPENNFNAIIFPNPTTGLITIETENIEKIEISDIHGRQVYTGISNTINLSQQPQGIYIIKVTTDKQTIAKKIIKQ